MKKYKLSDDKINSIIKKLKDNHEDDILLYIDYLKNTNKRYSLLLRDCTLKLEKVIKEKNNEKV